jgi:N-acyl-L-homoserine lactone synthetase
METIINQLSNYSIRRIGKEGLLDVAKFVVHENLTHHAGESEDFEVTKAVEHVYQEELSYYNDSTRMIIARSNTGQMIGCIRVFKWNRKMPLPIEKLFGINPLQSVSSEDTVSYWHVGRFAVNSFCGQSTITLFKQLMAYAIEPIVNNLNSFMIAETDSHLLRVMNVLGIGTSQLGHAINYLASDTVPVCSSRNDLMPFYNRFGMLITA